MNIQNKVFTNYSDWQKAYHKNQNFNAITIDNELHPFETHNKEVFVYGKGWNKIVKKKIVEVPALSDNTNLNDYFIKYGENCLYYALTSQQLGSNDCCWKTIQNEFTAMVAIGIDKWLSVLERFHSLKAKIDIIYLNKWNIVPDNSKMQYTKGGVLLLNDNIFTLNFEHYISYPFLRCKPRLNPIKDDISLANTYFLCVLDANSEVYLKDNEFDNTSVKQRLTMLFSEQIANEYEALMHPFN